MISTPFRSPTMVGSAVEAMVSESELMNMASRSPKNTSANARPCRA